MKKRAVILLAGLFSATACAFGQFTISGKVIDKQQGAPLKGANIVVDNAVASAVSDDQGLFSLAGLKAGTWRISASFVGFATIHREILLNKDTSLVISMEGAPVLGDEVNIIATRAHEKYPTAFSSISRKEMQIRNLGKDIPSIILESPSVVSTSDAGNGVGYSGISIRGTNLTRINVTINSIPLNEAESQGVWFVDIPDLASSTADLQIQRGVGTSTNGAGAFGASINFMTSDLRQDPYGELDLSGGSFGTFKSTLRFGTGLMANKFSVDGRVSYIHSDGYIDRAFSDLKSYYLSAGYYGKKTTIRLINFSGNERTYQAWEGVPKDSLATNRTYNPAGEYYDKNGNRRYYDNQTDNYTQDHFQFIVSHAFSPNWNLNTALHYTRGNGYYESYDAGASFADYGLGDVIIGGDTITNTDLVNRKMMDNDFYGMTASVNYTLPDRLRLTLGGAWNRYDGRHFGRVIWAEYASGGDNSRKWYYNEGEKTDFNVFIKANYQLTRRLSLFADMQYRRVRYSLDGTLDDLRTLDQSHLFDFFNPKAGLYFSLSSHHEMYASFGMANREPNRDNYKDADPGHIPGREVLYDYEIGYTWKGSFMKAGVNLYYMDYKDQLVLTGEINNVGEAVMVNVPRSYRTGIELTAGLDLFRRKLQWNVNATFSRNRIPDFTQYIDNYDADWNTLEQVSKPLGETDLSFSPSVIAGSVITWKPFSSLSVSLNSKYVSRQYIDNTSEKSRSLDPWFINGVSAQFTLRTKLIREIVFNASVNNIFSVKYETNGWVYPYYLDGKYCESNGYFPQAPANFLAGVSVRL